MKKIILVMLSLVLLMPVWVELVLAQAQAEEGSDYAVSVESSFEKPLYQARTNVEFNIRREPRDGGRRLITVPKSEDILVYELGVEWSAVSYGGVQGYCKTRWFWLPRSLDPFSAKVPNYKDQAGYAQVTSEVFAKVTSYGGNTLREKDMIAIYEINQEANTAVVFMMRSQTEIPLDSIDFSYFTPWEEARPGEIIMAYTSFYNEKTGGKLASARAYNIELACDRIDGVVIEPNALFSYNSFCEPYTKGNGYKLAPNISRAGQGYGGGVCQLSTALYNAVLGLPLLINEWVIHRDAGVPYVPVAFDAAVGSYSDFIFTNTLSYPIQIKALPQDGVLTVLILRAEELI